jgi:hypothetical protein
MSPAFTLLPAPSLPLDVLQGDWWVPGSTSRADLAKYSGKAQWQEILQVTPDVCLMWAQRATQDHTRLFFGLVVKITTGIWKFYGCPVAISQLLMV